MGTKVSSTCVTTSIFPLRTWVPHSGKQPNHPNQGSETNVVQVVQVVLHVTAMVETEMRTDVKVVVVMLVWTRAALETTSNLSSVVEWEVSEEVVGDHQVVVVDLVLLHRPENTSLTCILYACHFLK